MESASTPEQSLLRPAQTLSKVAEATALFWVIKILTTGMGECISDALVADLGIAAIVLGAVALAAALIWQFRAPSFRVWPYWSAVAMVSVFGTMVADGIRKGLGLTYVTTTVIFGILVIAVLSSWYASERTLSIHSITTPRREVFYWSTVISTFALGTAVGDMFASTVGWGFLDSGLGFCILIGLPAIAYRFLGLNSVAAFWASYVVTRPLGASFADYASVGQPAGLGLGKNMVSALTLIVYLGAVLMAARLHDGEPRNLSWRTAKP